MPVTSVPSKGSTVLILRGPGATGNPRQTHMMGTRPVIPGAVMCIRYNSVGGARKPHSREAAERLSLCHVKGIANEGMEFLPKTAPVVDKYPKALTE